jgi:hypothetical protein
MATAEFNIDPVGTGPYKFDQLIVENGQIMGVVLTLSTNYYGTPSPSTGCVPLLSDVCRGVRCLPAGRRLCRRAITSDVFNAALGSQIFRFIQP